MRVSVEPSMPSGILKAPPSKSAAHRLLLCAGLAEGKSVIRGLALSGDIRATLRCLEAIGCTAAFEGDRAEITGIHDFGSAGKNVLDCGESGSTLRFFLPLCLMSGNQTTLTGTEKLLSRPLGIYESLCAERGLLFRKTSTDVTVRGPLTGGSFTLPGDVSSQFISGLLFALPKAAGDSTIRILPPFESRPYVGMTIAALRESGVSAELRENSVLTVPGGQKYLPRDTVVEGDWSNAAFLFAFRESGADVRITGVNENSAQGDKCCLEYFDLLRRGCPTLDLADCPDLAPILFAFAAAHHGAEFLHTGRLRYKESDRLEAMRDVLSRFGAQLRCEGNNARVTAAPLKRPDCPVPGHNDHRVVMSAAYLLSLTGGRLEGAEAADKSFPGFFDQIKKAGVKISYEA